MEPGDWFLLEAILALRGAIFVLVFFLWGIFP